MSSPSSNHLCVFFSIYSVVLLVPSITLLFFYLSPIFSPSYASSQYILFFLFYSSSYLYAVNFLLILFPLLFHLFCALFRFLLRLLRYILLYLHFLFLLVIVCFHCFSYHSSFFFSIPSFALSSLFDQFCVLLTQVMIFSTNHVLLRFA